MDCLTERDYANEFKRRLLRRTAQVGVLRAVLAPLLDDPIRYPDDERGVAECLFCDGYDSLRGRHGPCCPVLLRDELLGRLTIGSD